MGLFTTTETYTYVVYSPVMGDSYNTTVKYGNRKEKVPLDVITTREMLALHGQGLNNSSKMKAQLKHLREIHNLPFLKKTGEFGTQRLDTKTIDFTKLETMYSSTIEDISIDVTSDLACEYLYKVTKGKYSSIYDIEDIISNDIIPKFNYNPLVPSITRPKSNVIELKEIYISYLGNSAFAVTAQVKSEITYKGDTTTSTGWSNITVNLPDEFVHLWDMANNPNIYIVKFANGNIIYLDQNSLANFQKQGDSKIEFSVPIGLKFKYISYSPKDAKKMELARTKLGYQEYKNKKRNRQELLYEMVQNNKDIDHDCRINMYLDLYPFKDPKYRADKNWRLFLKGVMRYFARITGIANIDEGKGFTSVSLPPYFLTSDKTFRYMNIEIIKEKVSGPDLSKSTPYCFFEKGKARNLNTFGGMLGLRNISKELRNLEKDKQIIKDFNTIWLCLIVDMGNNKFIKYKLNYSRFYEGLSGVNSSDKIVISTEIISNINKKLNRQLRGKYDPDTAQIEIPEIKEEVSQSEEDKALNMLSSKGKLRNAFWYDDKDISMAKWDKEAKKMKDKIPTGAPENGLSAFDVPKLPMPILMWNMIPYNGKKVAYTSTLLINFILNIKVKESTGLGALLAVAVAVIVTFITWNPGAGAKAGAATSSALIGVASATTAKAIITVGAWASAIGSISGNKFLSNIGMAIGAWAGISGVINGLNGGFGSLSALEMGELGLRGINSVIDVASKIRGLDIEKKLQSMADELKNGQKEFEYEKDNRKDMWGGVAKTNAAADEEIDQMMELTLQEGLFEVLTSYIDVEKNSVVFNDMKYDNTR